MAEIAGSEAAEELQYPNPNLTLTYFDVFATLPPLLPPGPIAILGFGAGSAANLLLNLYPHSVVHRWEIDPSVVDVAREYFGVADLEKRFPQRLFIHVGDALDAALESGFAGILVDLFSKGSLVPELQDPATWRAMKGRLKEGWRIMVNVGGSCVEAEDSGRDGRVVMEETLMAIPTKDSGRIMVKLPRYQKGRMKGMIRELSSREEEDEVLFWGR